MGFSITSVEQIPNLRCLAAFTPKTNEVFKESEDTTPVRINDRMEYMPWGASNDMPYQILDLIESDETLSTCQLFNAGMCYGARLVYDTANATAQVRQEVDDFQLDNDLTTYFFGVSQDFKHFGFCVTVIILNKEGSKIVRFQRKETCYCRFAPADGAGHIPYILYANWRRVANDADIEKIEVLDIHSPFSDLRQRLDNHTKKRKFAIITRIPTPDSTYYPIPYYASLFKGKWYSIKRLIGVAKEAKLKNSAPLKYHIEIDNKFWDFIFRAEGITDRKKQQERVVKEKQNIIDFLTGAENTGKVLFSSFYVTPDGKEQHDVVINKIDDSKEGGDWQTDIAEAINMFCFTMGVHSNLVGSVPGKSQSNNSGSDKRELYTIAQARQKPYHDLLFTVHRIIIRFNN